MKKRLPLALAVGLSFALLALLIWRAIEAVRSEEQTREAVVAERVFDELERALQARLEQEEERPFLHYNNRFLVDNDLGLPVAATSPLVESHTEPGLVGYFQRAPGGDLSNPYRRADGSEAVAPSDLATIEAEIEVALQAVPPTRPIDPGPPQAQQSGPPILQALNKGLQSKQRAAIVQSANASQLGNFLDPSTVLADPRRTGVEVEPFEVGLSERWLVFRRRVQLDGEPWVQGFVLRRDPFLRALEQSALGDLPGAHLAWDGAPGAHSHRFLPPFQDLTARLELAPLPGLRSTRVIVALALLVLLTTLGSALLVWRWLDESARMARQRTDFVAAVTHELRTPLTSIRMYAEMLEQGMAPPGARDSYLRTIRTEAERLGTLVEGVLTFAALERERPVVLGPTAPLGSIVEQVVEVLRPIAAQAQVELELTIGDGAHPVPRQALEQIAHNLIENAIKFADRDRIVRVTVDGRRLQVWNSSPPLSPRLLRTIFEPFVRGEPELTRRTKGTGIGLAVVHGLVAQLGGHIGARNDGAGVAFEVALPKSRLDKRAAVGQDSA